MRKRFLCCFIFFLLCLIFTRIVSASNDSEIVDVVVYGGYEKGYFEETEDGYSGFYPEYLESIKEENWTYNYHIPTGDAYTFLDSNDYDIIIGCPSESKKTNYVFSDVPIYAKHSVVAFQGSNSNMQIDNEFSMLNKWIGYYDDAEAEIFKLFCKVYNINYSNSSDPTILQLGLKSLSKADIYTKLENGTVDAILISDSLALEKEYKAVVSYSSKNVYLAANKNRNNKFLLAQENINDNKKENALFAKEIYDNIFYSVYNADLVISEEEQRILEEGISVRVGLLNNFSPYSFINSKNVATGLIIEALNEITLDTEEKINFTYKFYDSIAEINEAIEFGKCDISFLSFCDKEEITTKTFYSDKYVLYTSSNKKNIKVAVTSNISSSILEEFDIEKSNIKIYSNDEACLKACESGEVGYVISLKNVASYYINKNSLKAIILEVESENAFDFSLVSNDISDQALFSIINRSVDENYTKMLNDKLVELMIVDHNVKSFKDYIREHGTLILMWVILISTALILLLSIIIILLVVNSKKKYRLMYYDEVIDSENYQKFLLDAKKYISSNKKLAILYFDIRNFKYINSNFGTITGDMLLRDIAKYANILFKNLCFSRIYADKFVFLMEYEEEQEYKKRLQDSLKEFSGYTKEKYTNFNVFLKAGVYFADNSSDLEQAINLANYAAGESNVMSKNYVEYYNSDIYNQVVLEKDIERTMHHALEEK